ncbi:DUF4278 domain-containing protein [Thermosynechococcus vestitus]|uniref:Tlr0313 protein n=1 Tax=Thermosynechococcus vestitus (strain NIES-2133 / IAM M-273 / BP-1) TaxID=197221 RepID=Q8DM13_THEVB|nr:DUF4278 domain-containing protein [Thermosynechococcus vestitus]BAC07865.1 tlr0313 [Thermosynechococcus vestitus BP-1]BAY52356.1 hypothetical protein NIES2134_100360 [Thermostichus vulcanus NIES-2134]
MQLIYRGAKYKTSEQHIPLVESGAKGLYRGAPWVGHKPAETVPQPNHVLCWRGVTYQTNGQPVATTAPRVSAAPSVVPQRKRDSWVEAHRRAILETLERRLQVARSQGNQELISLLEEEWQQFA